MDGSQRTDEWLTSAVSALSSEGYRITRNTEYQRINLPVVAHLSEFQLTKIGNSETFFVFARFAAPSAEDVFEFSALAFEYADSSKVFPLPRGLFEGVWAFAVCIVEHIGETAVETIREETPPRHFSGAEIPVVYNERSGEISYFEGTPYWGAAYYQGFRKQIQKYLVFH